MTAVDCDFTEYRLAFNRFDESFPQIDEKDLEVALTSSLEMFNLCRCQGLGWLAWKRLTSSLDPKTLAFGHQGDFGGACPWKDPAGDQGMATLSREVRRGTLGDNEGSGLERHDAKDLQEKVPDESGVNWDETPVMEVGALFINIKGQTKNIAKCQLRNEWTQAD